ncbi:MAG: LssY C-terminal domain-containing protein [Candidatus Acidiferrum sp.]
MRRSLTICSLLASVCSLCSSFPAATQEANASAQSTTDSAILNPFAPNLAPPPSILLSTANSGSGPFFPSVRAGSPISPGIEAKIPRQVHSAAGVPGDVINFLVIGSKRDMKKAMDAAGWDTVACTKLGVIWRDLFESLYGKAYRGIPMSKLYLFGRHQDYGYAHSRGLLSVRNRHHFRIWLAPFQVNGQNLWIGAATHDIALHYLGHFLHFTHNIDPNVDAERQYVSTMLIKSGRVQVLGYLTVPDALTQAHTTTGQDFYTDGRILIMKVVPGKSENVSAGTDLP